VPVHKTITDERVVNVSPARKGRDIVRSLGLAVEKLKDQILPSKQQQEFLQERQRIIYLNLD
jgi:hypothetical protein